MWGCRKSYTFREKLGEDFYLWRRPGLTTGVAILSAHGCSLTDYPRFATPIDFGFYWNRNESSSAKLKAGLNAPSEMVFRGTCTEDYYLSKYQGYHGSRYETYDYIHKFIRLHGNNVAVITVRNRKRYFVRGKRYVTLYDLLTLLNNGNTGITQVNCLICRSPAYNERVQVMP